MCIRYIYGMFGRKRSYTVNIYGSGQPLAHYNTAHYTMHTTYTRAHYNAAYYTETHKGFVRDYYRPTSDVQWQACR
jgi:hypothetical protein